MGEALPKTPKVKSKNLRPGTLVIHASGTAVVLAKRKTDDSGWWNTDGSGLADFVLNAHDGAWTVVTPELLKAALLAAGTPDAP